MHYSCFMVRHVKALKAPADLNGLDQPHLGPPPPALGLPVLHICPKA